MENAVAIIGMTGRFPGADNLEKFWKNLYDGVESVKYFDRDKLLEMGVSKELVENPKYVSADAVLENMDKFDAGFFGYSARQAEIMDPQHRLFLESAWEVLESAGYSSEFYDGKVAVYAGANLSSYMIRNLYTNPGLVERLGSFKIMLANGQDFLATKVSHKLNLKGPSVNVNTLCSSSMVAVHFACQNLLNYGCDIALAGGVSFQVSRNEAFFYQEGGIGSSDGHCRAFDSSANGTVSGSGLAVLALKRFEDAVEDGDYIHAVIRSTAINNDGAEKNSYTAPSADGQADCIAEAIAMSGVNPETISYVDAHGTGTNLGDPIEIAGITKAYRAYTDKKQFCAIGSVKTNIGHLVHAGGVASLIKTVLSMQHEVIPASLNFREPNPKIDFVNSPFYVNTKRSKWERGGTPLRAGVSSFGIGGTNAHAILEEAPKHAPSEKSTRPCQLIVLSAKTDTALEKITSNLAEFIDGHPDVPLADIAFTLGRGRHNFSCRRALVCENSGELSQALKTLPHDGVMTRCGKKKELSAVFVFAGNANAYKGMGAQLYRCEKIYRDCADECADIIHKLTSADIRGILYEGTGAMTREMEAACLFVTEYSLARLLISWGIKPDLMLAEGAGEIAAACAAGVFSPETAIRIILGNSKDGIDYAGFSEPKPSVVSLRSGKRISAEQYADANYQTGINTDHAYNIESIADDYGGGYDRAFMILGPSDGKTAGGDGDAPVLCMIGIQKEHEGEKRLLRCMARFWTNGGKINWYKTWQGEKRNRIPLPTYPFERQRYWIEPGKGGNDTQSAELDRRPRPELDTPYVKPRSDTEKKIADICEEILGYDKIGVNDSFFELGGDSLLAVAVITKLRKTFKKDISLEKLYDNTTIASLAEIFGGESGADSAYDEDAQFDEGTL